MEKLVVFVVGHGDFPKYLLESVEMIAGETQDIFTFSLQKDMSLEDMIKDMEMKIKLINNPILILSDLFGGTPNNAAMYLKHIYDVNVISGVNLPMLLELVMTRDSTSDFDQLANNLVEKSKDSIVHQLI